jgi:hypothetical protein
MGPSAPNGPPVPIDIADNGFSTVIIGWILLSSVMIFSMVSGMSCPRIARDPNLAITCTINPPTTG